MKTKVVIKKKPLKGFEGNLYFHRYIKPKVSSWAPSKNAAKEFKTLSEASRFIATKNLQDCEPIEIEV